MVHLIFYHLSVSPCFSLTERCRSLKKADVIRLQGKFVLYSGVFCPLLQFLALSKSQYFAYCLGCCWAQCRDLHWAVKSFLLSCYSCFLLFCPCDQWALSWHCHLVWSMPRTGGLIISQNSATAWLRACGYNCGTVPFLSLLVTVLEHEWCVQMLPGIWKEHSNTILFFKQQVLLWSRYHSPAF